MSDTPIVSIGGSPRAASTGPWPAWPVDWRPRGRGSSATTRPLTTSFAGSAAAAGHDCRWGVRPRSPRRARASEPSTGWSPGWRRRRSSSSCWSSRRRSNHHEGLAADPAPAPPGGAVRGRPRAWPRLALGDRRARTAHDGRRLVRATRAHRVDDDGPSRRALAPAGAAAVGGASPGVDCRPMAGGVPSTVAPRRRGASGLARRMRRCVRRVIAAMRPAGGGPRPAWSPATGPGPHRPARLGRRRGRRADARLLHAAAVERRGSCREVRAGHRWSTTSCRCSGREAAATGPLPAVGLPGRCSSSCPEAAGRGVAPPRYRRGSPPAPLGQGGPPRPAGGRAAARSWPRSSTRSGPASLEPTELAVAAADAPSPAALGRRLRHASTPDHRGGRRCGDPRGGAQARRLARPPTATWSRPRPARGAGGPAAGGRGPGRGGPGDGVRATGASWPAAPARRGLAAAVLAGRRAPARRSPPR